MHRRPRWRLFNALATQSVNPDFYSTAQTFFAYGALILGGAATVFGPVLGAMLFWFLLAIPDALLRRGHVGADPPAGPVQPTGRCHPLRHPRLAIILMMVFRLQGLIGNKREVQLSV